MLIIKRIFFFILRKKINLKSHWVIGHHPLIIIPLAGISSLLVTRMLGFDNAIFIVSLSVICTMAHFIHDSFSPIGFHWLSPFNWKLITIKHGWPEIVASLESENIRKKILGNADGKIDKEISLRLEKISQLQIISASALLVLCAVLVYFF